MLTGPQPTLDCQLESEVSPKFKQGNTLTHTHRIQGDTGNI